MSSISAILPVSLRDLSSTGSGAQVSTTEIAEAINTLNHSGVTAQNILKLAADADKRNAGRERNNNKKREDLAKVYASAQRMTSSVIFGKGNGQLGSEVYNEVLTRTKNTKNKILESKRKKNRKLAERQKEVKAIRQKLKQKENKLNALSQKDLKMLCLWKKGPKDKGVSTLNKEELTQRYNKTKSNKSDDSSESSEEEQVPTRSNQDQADDDSSESSEEEQIPTRRSTRLTQTVAYNFDSSEDEMS